jgi:hypothetical protein
MIGEPDAGNPHVRFDEGRQETCVRAARLSPTLQRPQKDFLLELQLVFVRSALQLIPLFRRTHVSAVNFRMSLFRLLGVAISLQPQGLEPLRAYPCVDERACRAIRGSR